MNTLINAYAAALRSWLTVVLGLVMAVGAGAVWAQAEDDDEPLEEITVTGTQIKGARIADALAVSVFSADDIEVIGLESGDEFLDSVPEMGQNTFSETDTAGGVNAARGDVGAINMRNMGTGNTLVLLNGRRLVNMATYQTEEVGGSFVPVNSVNSNHIPVFGVERVEILRDGASAIYGADAVAGVINTVLKDDFEGLTIRARYNDFDNLPRNDEALSVEWGDSFNDGRTYVGVFARHYRRDRVNSQDDPRWANSDFRYRLPEGTPEEIADEFQSDSSNSLWGQFDLVPGSSTINSSHSLRTTEVVDGSGEFEVYPIGDPRCINTDPDAVAEVYDLGFGTCAHEDGQGTVRYNLNDNRDLMSELERTSLYAYFNHEVNSNVETFGELYYYNSTTSRLNAPSVDLSSVVLRVGAENYYNPFGRATIDGQPNPNRLDDPDGLIYDDVPASGYDLFMDLYRFAEYPRIIDNDGEASRFLVGLRGSEGDWDWESAVTWSEATRDDIERNRISNTLMTSALFDPTPNAYNPFSGGVDTNVERTLIDVYRKGKSTLSMWDLKFSNPEIFEMPAGPVGFVAGYEWRRETYVDDRDPRLDGTIVFMRESDPLNAPGVFDIEGDFDNCDDPPEGSDLVELCETYPLTSDVVGSSPTPDGRGSRTTNSVFAEFQVPLHETLDMQLAVRYEDFDDVGETTVGKLAFGWRPTEMLLFRGSWSQAFRAPNLITINEQFVARTNTRNDWVCFFGVDQGTLDEDTYSDCDYGVQRRATGSRDLKAERSTNTSLGVVFQPLESLTFTFDYWTIEKEDTIGLFGEENQILYDLVLRLQAGAPVDSIETIDDIGDIASCAEVDGNPLVNRGDYDDDDLALINGFLSAGLCPVGRASFVDDSYRNFDTRTIEGYDVGIYYDFSTAIGDFYLRYNGAFYDTLEQTASSARSLEIEAAKDADSRIIYPLIGIGDLLGINGNFESKQSASIAWSKGSWGASVAGTRIGDFDQILDTSDPWPIDAMTTYNAKIDYSFDAGNIDTRVRLGINNFTDERAPLAEDSFGIYKDTHRDWGRNWYLDVKMSF